ncbi:class I adenylate-forming enzyme family protein [Achromobacter deleyi]|uniref:class I adenylate-forming enzyme family protein n=1 Tax=Achromobacter deleyi TaxID=1353891 RepID=UPI001465F0D9|nr:AMP-binding protein [Achromobacter deleyi]CAB3888947.1 3-[(3aS,4S,7aS)-7a-methyl-1, 5-dioxo-octahydro-1H-inden-4-yl]propanoyl:CoA ligase [Achromobacter deleyi]
MYPIDFFFRAAEQYPDRVALDAPEGQVTFARLAADVRALAAALQDLDPAPQTRVALCAGNSSRHILALLAVLASGKIWVPLNYRSTAREIGRILDATEPSIVIVDAAGDALVPIGVGQRISLGADAAGLAVDALLAGAVGREPLRHALPREATQAIKFTGGTTGLPKGVMQPYHAWNAGIINQITSWGLTPDDRYVVAAPVTHGTGTYLLPVLASGGAHVLLDAATPAAITAAFRERGGTLSFMPPTLIYMIMAQPGVSRADFPRLRNLIYGGAPMPPEKIERARAFFGPVLGTTYGQTEAPQIVTVLRPADLEAPENRASVGRVTWLSDVAIMAPDGALLPRGEIGEVVVRGDLVMSGYWRLPEKTAETLIDGWLHTGDTGLIDARGYLFLKDRLRDVIITGGFNVYPVDVENALSAHPAVYECSVFGLPDDKWGEAVHAAVQFHPGAMADADALKAHVRGLLGPVATPKQFHIHDSLPRSPVGKVLKNAVRDAALKETP